MWLSSVLDAAAEPQSWMEKNFGRNVNLDLCVGWIIPINSKMNLGSDSENFSLELDIDAIEIGYDSDNLIMYVQLI